MNEMSFICVICMLKLTALITKLDKVMTKKHNDEQQLCVNQIE